MNTHTQRDERADADPEKLRHELEHSDRQHRLAEAHRRERQAAHRAGLISDAEYLSAARCERAWLARWEAAERAMLEAAEPR